MAFCISLSSKQGNSGRITVAQADWIMSLVFRFPERVFKGPDESNTSLHWVHMSQTVL